MTISSVTSEALQLKLRQLLPSQQGFGTDLSASDTIIPVIDLTASAEGSSLPSYLQSAASFGNITGFSVSNATTTLINTTGFWKVYGLMTFQDVTPGLNEDGFSLTDGFATKRLWGANIQQAGATNINTNNFEFTLFLAAGDSLVVDSHAAHVTFVGSYWQVADNNGTLVQPSGFNPQ